MEVTVNAAGQRIFINSPAPDQYDRNLLLYDPNNASNSNLGLYDRSQQSCKRWVDQFYQFQREHPTPPQNIVDRDGRTYYAERPRLGYLGQNFVAYKR